MVTQCFRNPDPMANPRLLDGSLGGGGRVEGGLLRSINPKKHTRKKPNVEEKFLTQLGDPLKVTNQIINNFLKKGFFMVKLSPGIPNNRSQGAGPLGPHHKLQKTVQFPEILRWDLTAPGLRSFLDFLPFLLGLHFLSFWPFGPSFPLVLAFWAFISFHFLSFCPFGRWFPFILDFRAFISFHFVLLGVDFVHFGLLGLHFLILPSWGAGKRRAYTRNDGAMVCHITCSLKPAILALSGAAVAPAAGRTKCFCWVTQTK